MFCIGYGNFYSIPFSLFSSFYLFMQACNWILFSTAASGVARGETMIRHCGMLELQSVGCLLNEVAIWWWAGNFDMKEKLRQQIVNENVWCAVPGSVCCRPLVKWIWDYTKISCILSNRIPFGWNEVTEIAFLLIVAILSGPYWRTLLGLLLQKIERLAEWNNFWSLFCVLKTSVMATDIWLKQKFFFQCGLRAMVKCLVRIFSDIGLKIKWFRWGFGHKSFITK